MIEELYDTDIVINFFKKKEPIFSYVDKQIKQSRQYMSVISLAELRTGWTEEQLKDYLPFVETFFEILPVSSDIALQAGFLRRQCLEKNYLGNPLTDQLIAATAIVKNLQLLTLNTKDFPHESVKLNKSFI